LIKVSKKNKSKKNTSNNQHSDINEIEKMIDKIILKNKNKIDELHAKESEINVDRLSIKNKHGDTLFYLKKRSKKDPGETEVLSGEIIEKARSNLGEGPLPEEKAIVQNESKDEPEFQKPDAAQFEEKPKKLLVFDKKDYQGKDVENKETKDETLVKTKDVLESEDFGHVVEEIDSNLEETSPPIKTDLNKEDIEINCGNSIRIK